MSLAFSTEGGGPERVVFLHGLLGRGGNWRGIARRLVAARPELRALLVDLRMHGGSLGEAGPHTVAAAAADLDALATGARLVVGHSFGGKVAMAFAARAGARVERLAVVDASPSVAAPGSDDAGTARVLATLAEQPPSLPDRAAFVSHLEARGLDRALAQWLGQSIAPADNGGVRFALDSNAIRSLYADYRATDCWGVLESPPAGLRRVDVILGERSSVWSAADRARVAAIAARDPRVRVHALAAGHFVHVEQPEALVAILAADSSG